MGDRSENKPQLLLSQSNTSNEVGDYFYPEADFVLVHGSKVHLWVDGMYFVEDPNGAIEEGRYFLIRDTGLGVIGSKIESVRPKEDSVLVRHVFHWEEGELQFPDSKERWRKGEITGEFDRALGAGSESVFLRRVE